MVEGIITMITLKQDINDLKIEINKFIELLNMRKKIPNEHELRCISKHILFQKSFFVLNYKWSKTYYKKCMVYDSLLLMNALSKSSVLYFYQLYRAYIENFIRTILDFEDDDETGINAMIKILEEKTATSQELKTIFYYIKGEYSKSCEYVHSNIKADIKVYSYYEEIIKSDEMNTDNLITLINKLKTLLVMSSKMILLMYSVDVESMYYRKYEVLKFLIGEKLFAEYKQCEKI